MLLSSSQIQLQHPQHEFNPLELRSAAKKKYNGTGTISGKINSNEKKKTPTFTIVTSTVEVCY
jgi:hypothetical protein